MAPRRRKTRESNTRTKFSAYARGRVDQHDEAVRCVDLRHHGFSVGGNCAKIRPEARKKHAGARHQGDTGHFASSARSCRLYTLYEETDALPAIDTIPRTAAMVRHHRRPHPNVEQRTSNRRRGVYAPATSRRTMDGEMTKQQHGRAGFPTYDRTDKRGPRRRRPAMKLVAANPPT